MQEGADQSSARKPRRRLSYANIVSTVALVFAIGGGSALAAGTLASHPKPKPKPHPPKLTLNKADKSYISTQISSGHVAFATTAQSATSAKSADTATTAANATTATNATELGGVAASGFTHNDCVSETGQVKGFVTVPASTTFPATFTGVQGYNCSGQAIQAKRLGAGDYEVQFLGSGPAIAIGNVDLPSNATPGLAAFITVKTISNGDFEVLIDNPNAGGNHLEDDQFSLVTP
jgi:hypothetical protein